MSELSDKRTAQTDDLAAMAAAGDAQALGELWTLHSGLLCLLCRKWYNRNRDIATAHGLTLEDLDQEAFFALKYTAEHYVPEKGAFSTLLSLAFKNHIRHVLCGEHVRLVQGANGKPAQVSGNPLNSCISLDEELAGEDDGITRAETVADPTALEAFDRVEDLEYSKQLRTALDDVLATLTATEAQVIRGRYFEGKTLSALAAEMGRSGTRIRTIERAALQKLSCKDGRLQQFRADITGRVYSGTGFTAWETSGSVEERIPEILESAGCL